MEPCARSAARPTGSSRGDGLRGRIRPTPEAAIAAARAAFDFRHLARNDRARPRRAAARGWPTVIERDAKEFARAESLDTGKRLVESRIRHGRRRGLPALLRRASPGTSAGRVVDTGRADAISRIVHEPIGVCALITPWNYPLLQVSWKVAPCTAGRQHLRPQAERADAVDGDPADEGARRSRSAERRGQPDPGGRTERRTRRCPSTHDVDMVSFTGGLAIRAGASPRSPRATVKRVALELGGKNPNVVFADADLETRSGLRAHGGVPALRDRCARPAPG